MIGVANLLLDVSNPRFETEQENQRDAIRTMAEEQGTKLLNLAEDILRFSLDPSSLAIVIPAEKGNRRYIVVEGNRRIVALKLLQNPDLAKGVWQLQHERRLKALSDQFSGNRISQVWCVVLPDRETASHWIQLRHRGEQQGRGIVSWDGLAAARYEERRGGGRARAALQAVDFVRQHGDLDQATIDRLGDVPITTVQRLLNDPDVRKALGIDLENGRLMSRLPDKEVLKGLTRIIRDAARGDLKVSRVETKKHRQEYVKSFASSELPAATVPPGEAHDVAGDVGQPSKSRRKSAAQPSRNRAVLIPRKCVLTILVSKPNDIYHELRMLKLQDTPYAIAVLFRVFLELSVDQYIVRKKLLAKPELNKAKLRAKLIKVADNLQSSAIMTKRELVTVRRLADPQHFLAASIETLHSYVHDANLAPGPADLRAAWDSVEPFFQKLWE
jgi:hypothetical protein